MDAQHPDPSLPNQPQSLEELRLGSPVFGAGPEDYHRAAEDAAQALFRKDYRNALRLYSRLLLLDSAKPLGWMGYVLCLHFMNQTNQAILWARNAERSLAPHPIGEAFALCAARIAGDSSPSACQWRRQQNPETRDPIHWILLGWLHLLIKDENPVESFRAADREGNGENWQIPMFAGVLLEKYERISAAQDFYARARLLLKSPSVAQERTVSKPPSQRSNLWGSIINLFNRWRP